MTLLIRILANMQTPLQDVISLRYGAAWASGHHVSGGEAPRGSFC